MIPMTLYVVDDEKTILEGISFVFGDRYVVKTFPTAEKALESMEQALPDLVLLDIALPGMNGFDALREMKRISPELPVIMITAYEEVRSVVTAMKEGAYDYVVKPLHMDSLEVSVRNAIESVRLKREIRGLQEKAIRENFPFFLGESEAVQDLMEFVGLLAKSPDTPVLIIGETGTGKELIASHIHLCSPNFRGRLVSVNCSAIPMELFESELFGYEKGAFTGASGAGKRGLVEAAENGTLFLDEIGDLDLRAQAKLLRFLEEGEFYRVGGTKKLRVQTRIISATNKDLRGLIEKEQFRQDLYHRLAVAKVAVPSLNERQEDIVPMALTFLKEFNTKLGKAFTGISPEAQDLLRNHRWEGNVRELRNCVERGVLIGKGPELFPRDMALEVGPGTAGDGQEGLFPAGPLLPPGGVDLRSALNAVEKGYIEEAMRLADGNESRAAGLLRLNHQTFRYRRRKLSP